MEPLVTFRECVTGKRVIRQTPDGMVELGGRKYSMHTKTAFTVRSGVKGPDAAYHELGSLFLQFKNLEAPLMQLRTICQAAGVKYMLPTDKASLMRFLRGESADGDGRVDLAYVAPTPTAKQARPAHATATSKQAAAATAIHEARKAFETELEKLQAAYGPTGAHRRGPGSTLASADADAGEGVGIGAGAGAGAGAGDEAKGSDEEATDGTVNDILPPASKRRRLRKAEDLKEFKKFLDYDVAFTMSILTTETKPASCESVLNTRSKDLRSMFEKLRAQRAAVREAREQAEEKERTAVRGTPIIIVPSAQSSVINLYNAKQFLEEGVYVDPNEAKRKAGGIKPGSVTMQKEVRGVMAKFHIIDNVRLLKPADWAKVIAVFAHGPLWQFKNWMWKTPVDIFSRVLGFHLHYDSTEMGPNVSKWRVIPLVISQAYRNRDPVAMQEFWRHTVEFVRVKKPHLLPSKRRSPTKRARGGPDF